MKHLLILEVNAGTSKSIDIIEVGSKTFTVEELE
jgi:hypothetical protein